MSVAAVIVAAGSGTRMGTGNRKQFIELNGKPIYMWSVLRFRMHPDISQLIVCAPPDMVQSMQTAIDDMRVRRSGSDAGLRGTTSVVPGGATRQESVFNGLSAIASGRESEKPSHVLVHDAARPFLTSDVIDRVIDTLKQTDACTVAMPASDTVKRVVDGRIVETLNREELFLMQTPQGARFDLLYRAHQQAREAGIATTDDAAILEAAGIAVNVVMGSRFNIKVTEKDDLQLSQAIATTLGESLM